MDIKLWLIMTLHIKPKWCVNGKVEICTVSHSHVNNPATNSVNIHTLKYNISYIIVKLDSNNPAAAADRLVCSLIPLMYFQPQ